jgi:hypothetical protein
MFDLVDSNCTYAAYSKKVKNVNAVVKTDSLSGTGADRKKARSYSDFVHSVRIESEHPYALSPEMERKRDTPNEKRASASLDLLFAVNVPGSEKKIMNTLPRAVAVLSNSKKLFLDHLSTLFKCLDPKKAELCYVDTDSCIWSISEAKIEDCLRPDRLELWREKNIMANEYGAKSCHGKMKLEGTFAGGLFTSMKIYRLFQVDENFEPGAFCGGALNKEADVVADEDDDDEDDGVDDVGASGVSDCTPEYTRCKGISRRLAESLSDATFDHEKSDRTVVRRCALRANRTGEISLVTESRSVSAPFNLKRYVTEEGLHTFSLSERAKKT